MFNHYLYFIGRSIIGKGGETIKGMQTKSGARIQVDMSLVMVACHHKTFTTCIH
jgi:hypothetical protein